MALAEANFRSGSAAGDSVDYFQEHGIHLLKNITFFGSTVTYLQSVDAPCTGACGTQIGLEAFTF